MSLTLATYSDDVNSMTNEEMNIAEQLAVVIEKFQLLRTGHSPTSVSVVLGEETLVVTLHDALTKAEKALAGTPEGAAQVQDFHRKLFASSEAQLREEIQRITGRKVRESAAEIQPETGSIVHAFTTGAMVQMFLLTKPDNVPPSDVVTADENFDKGKEWRHDPKAR